MSAPLSKVATSPFFMRMSAIVLSSPLRGVRDQTRALRAGAPLDASILSVSPDFARAYSPLEGGFFSRAHLCTHDMPYK